MSGFELNVKSSKEDAYSLQTSSVAINITQTNEILNRIT